MVATALSEVLISTNQVSRLFKFGSKEFLAVENISLEIQEGQIVNLIGESGCGKSTLGRLCIGIIKPSSGLVLYRGRDVWSLTDIDHAKFRRSAQLIHQNPYGSFNPMKNIYQSLAAPIVRYKIADRPREIKEKTSNLLEMVGLQPPEDFLYRYPHQLSGGQLQRIAIARTLSIAPEFIVADEPTSMLDASLRVEILDLLISIRKREKLSYLHITHDFALARYFGAEQISIILYFGSVMEQGVTKELIHEPLHPYSKVLVSAAPVRDPKMARSIPLPELRSLDLPDPMDPPSGCPFHPRCPSAMDICKRVRPDLLELENGKKVACHMYP